MTFQEAIRALCNEATWRHYRAVRIAYVAYSSSGMLRPLRFRAQLFPRRLKEPELRGEAHGLTVRRHWLPASRFRRALEKQRGDLLSIERDHLLLAGEEGRDFEGWYPPPTVGMSRVGWFSLLAQGVGPEFTSILGKVDFDWLGTRLTALRPDRFRSWEHVAQVIGVGAGELHVNMRSQVEIFAPEFARVVEAAYSPQDGGKLIVDVENHLDTACCALELLVTPSRSTEPSVAIPFKKWKPIAPHRWQATASAPADAGEVKIDISVDGRRLSETTVAVPTLSARLLEALDGGREWLESLLFPAKGEGGGRDFERGVAALLGLSGISVLPTGEKGKDRFVDLLAWPDQERFVVGECTVAAPALAKLAKLKSRAVQIQRRAALDGRAPRMLAAAFVPHESEDLPQEVRDEAGRLGVIVVDGSRLRILLALASSGESPAGIWNLLTSWSSSVEQPLRRRRLR